MSSKKKVYDVLQCEMQGTNILTGPDGSATFDSPLKARLAPNPSCKRSSEIFIGTI